MCIISLLERIAGDSAANVINCRGHQSILSSNSTSLMNREVATTSKHGRVLGKIEEQTEFEN